MILGIYLGLAMVATTFGGFISQRILSVDILYFDIRVLTMVLAIKVEGADEEEA